MWGEGSVGIKYELFENMEHGSVIAPCGGAQRTSHKGFNAVNKGRGKKEPSAPSQGRKGGCITRWGERGFISMLIFFAAEEMWGGPGECHIYGVGLLAAT